MTRRAFFFDLDGTLAIRSGPPSEADTAAIRRARDKGNLAFLCTGRAPCHIYESIRAIGFDGVVAGAGTYVELGGRVIFRQTMDPTLLRLVLAELLRGGDFAVMEGEREVYAVNPDPDSWAAPLRRLEDPDIFTPGVGQLAGEPILKFAMKGNPRGDVRELLRGVMQCYDHGTSMEFIPLGISKAEGMRLVLEQVGIPREDSVAFGDSANDLEMLRYAGLGIAMGDAIEAVRQAADRVTGSLADSGVAMALGEILGDN